MRDSLGCLDASFARRGSGNDLSGMPWYGGALAELPSFCVPAVSATDRRAARLRARRQRRWRGHLANRLF
jgi:hypothetical protein